MGPMSTSKRIAPRRARRRARGELTRGGRVQAFRDHDAAIPSMHDSQQVNFRAVRCGLARFRAAEPGLNCSKLPQYGATFPPDLAVRWCAASPGRHCSLSFYPVIACH
jgi:hypothetical protein